MTKPSRTCGGQRRRPKRPPRWIPAGRCILVGMRLAGRPRARMSKRRDRNTAAIAAKAGRPALQAAAPAPFPMDKAPVLSLMGKAPTASPATLGSGTATVFGAGAGTTTPQGGFGRF